MRLAHNRLISLWPVAALAGGAPAACPRQPRTSKTGRCFLNQRAAHSQPQPEALESSRLGKGDKNGSC
jgi:hypothetical protein